MIPENTQLTPWPDEPAEVGFAFLRSTKKLYARQAEVFAGYAAYTDNEIGRVIQAVEDMGKLDNTHDHLHLRRQRHQPGRHPGGRLQPDDRLQRHSESPEALQMLHYENWGSDKTYPHMSVGWSWAFDTPFKWTKQVASHFGGTRQGMAISWPGHIKDVGGIRSQFHHMIDIVPTLLEATGIKAPDTVNGIKQKPIEGVSMAYTFDQANAKASPSKRTTQYFEMAATAGFTTTAGWPTPRPSPRPGIWLRASCPSVIDGYKWELYNLTEDFSQNNDLSPPRIPPSSRRCRRCS